MRQTIFAVTEDSDDRGTSIFDGEFTTVDPIQKIADSGKPRTRSPASIQVSSVQQELFDSDQRCGVGNDRCLRSTASRRRTPEHDSRQHPWNRRWQESSTSWNSGAPDGHGGIAPHVPQGGSEYTVSIQVLDSRISLALFPQVAQFDVDVSFTSAHRGQDQ